MKKVRNQNQKKIGKQVAIGMLAVGVLGGAALGVISALQKHRREVA